DHHVEQRDDRGGVGEIANAVAEMDQVRQALQHLAIGVPQLALKADAWQRQRRERCGKPRERYRPAAVVLVRRRAGPDKSGARAAGRQTLAPIFAALRRRSEIWNLGRDRPGLRSECKRKAEQGTMQVERRKWLAACNDLDHREL